MCHPYKGGESTGYLVLATFVIVIIAAILRLTLSGAAPERQQLALHSGHCWRNFSKGNMNGHFRYQNMAGWWFGTCFTCPYIGIIWNNNPNWLSYFSEGLKPPTRLYWYSIRLLQGPNFPTPEAFTGATAAISAKSWREHCARPIDRHFCNWHLW